MFRVISASLLSALALGSVISAQSRGARTDAASCQDEWRASYCEVREDSFASQGSLDVDASPNGGISVSGSDRADIRIRTRITARADSEAAARSLAGQVRVVINGSRIRAEGPPQRGNENWTASFEIDAPRNERLQLTAHNGGIAVNNIDGYGRFTTKNGGIALSNVSGDLQGETVNGGISVNLSAPALTGAGLSFETRNGGITLSVPRSFGAQLEASTVNGGVSSDFPVAQTAGNRSRHIVATLGAGGAPLHLTTVNGGIRISRR
jgi:DUF4097 and DUF4098 domain-containing protein YvlB